MRIWFAKNSQKVFIDRQILPLSSLDRKGLILSNLAYVGGRAFHLTFGGITVKGIGIVSGMGAN